MKTYSIAIQYTDREPWKTIKKFQSQAGWLSRSFPQHVKPYFFVGSDNSKIMNLVESSHEYLRWSRVGRITIPVDRIISKFFSGLPTIHTEMSNSHVPTVRVEIPDLFFLLNQKYLGAYQYFLKHTTADYLFTTNINNYCQLNLLSEIIQTLPSSGVYAGTTLQAGKKSFISGANRILSRDIVELIVNNSKSIDKGYIEDVALGIFLQNRNIRQITLKTLNIHSIDELQIIPTGELLNFHQIRVKCASSRIKNDLLILMELMNKLGIRP